jgi:hypothetical protein
MEPVQIVIDVTPLALSILASAAAIVGAIVFMGWQKIKGWEVTPEWTLEEVVTDAVRYTQDLKESGAFDVFIPLFNSKGEAALSWALGAVERECEKRGLKFDSEAVAVKIRATYQALYK